MSNGAHVNLYSLILGLPDEISHPDHYQILNVPQFIDDPKLIRDAAAAQNGKVLKWQNSEYFHDSLELTRQLVEAMRVLSDADAKREYDEALRKPKVVSLTQTEPVSTVPIIDIGVPPPLDPQAEAIRRQRVMLRLSWSLVAVLSVLVIVLLAYRPEPVVREVASRAVIDNAVAASPRESLDTQKRPAGTPSTDKTKSTSQPNSETNRQTEPLANIEEGTPGVKPSVSPSAALQSLTIDEAVQKLTARGASFSMGSRKTPDRITLRVEILTDEDLQWISAIPTLKYATIEQRSKRVQDGNTTRYVYVPTEATPAGFRQLGNLRNLDELYLYGPIFADEVLSEIGQFTNLEVVHVAYPFNLKGIAKLTVKGIESLAGLCNLSRLSLGHCDEYTEPMMVQIAKLSELTSLTLNYARISESGLRHLQNLPKLSSLNLHGVEGLSGQGLETIAGLPELKALYLGYGKFPDAELAKISAIMNLERLSLNDLEIDDSDLANLLPLQKLRYLSLQGCPITDSGLETLTKLPKLREITLGRTKITDAGLKTLSTVTDLERLYLSYTKIGNEGLAHLRTLTNLKFLSFDGSEVTDEGLAVLENMANLEYVTLNTKISPEAVARLKESLPKARVYQR